METRLRNLDWLHSVWRITAVNPFVHNYDPHLNKIIERHSAPFPESLAHRLIELYSKKGETVLDPFAGSGTTNFMALSLFRKTVGYELEKKYVEMITKRCSWRARIYNKSCEKMDELNDSSMQLCITSPPYLNLRKYSDNPSNIGNMKNPYPTLKNVFTEVFRVLKPSGYFCLNVGNAPENKGVATFPYDMVYLCKEIGFRFKNSIVWDKGVSLKEWNVQHKQILENHEYVWIFQKPEAKENGTRQQTNSGDTD